MRHYLFVKQNDFATQVNLTEIRFSNVPQFETLSF